MIRRAYESLLRRGTGFWVGLGYAAVVALFVWMVAQFYIPGKGLSYLIMFGSRQEDARLSKIRQLDYYVSKASDGYDAQYYVQIAMDPSLQNQALKRAVDSLSYRGRRILFAATAYAFGLGQPAWILQAFALQNVVTWFLLGGLLLHWFPPRSWDNLVRWAGVMLSFGVCLSFRNALFDGPCLLLVALGVYLLDKGRPWWATAVFALGGLGKETNLLGSAALLPGWSDGRRAWGLAIVRGLLTVVPLALWVLYITMYVGGRAGDVGARNFDLPFVAYGRKWGEVLDGLPEVWIGNTGPFWSLLMLVALTAQFLYLILRPQWRQAWWRIGFSYAVLLIFLGDAVWEGYPGAASRVLLPMQLAFNVLVPAGRGWWVVLVLGNLTMLAAPSVLEPPLGDGYVVRGRDELIYGTGRKKVDLQFADAWYLTERHGADYWRWSPPGGARLTIHNPQTKPLVVRVRFTLTVAALRKVQLRLDGTELWSTVMNDKSMANVTVNEVILPPGASTLEFFTEEPATLVGTDPRPLALQVQNLRLDLLRKAP